MVRSLNYLAILATAAYALNSSAYVYRLGSITKSPQYGVALLIGSMLVIAGYIVMTVSNGQEIEIEKEKKEKEVNPSEAWGTGLLALFFVTSLFAGTNITVQLYDPLGAVGYTSLFISNWFQVFKFIGLPFLIAYYIWGGLFKIGEEGFTNRAQLVGRGALAVFYAATLATLLT